MTFRRTDPGLSNMHRFLRVDAVVFVEGGPVTFTLAEISQGAGNVICHDIKYWSVVFHVFTPAKRFHFKGVGSKSTVREIAVLVTGGHVTHTLVAMDRDWDHLTGTLPTGSGVFSTAGYSWENDVWSKPVVFAAFRRFNSNLSSESEAEKTIDLAFRKFEHRACRCARADAALTLNKLDPLPRSEFEKLARPGISDSPPEFSNAAAKALIQGRKHSVRPTRVFCPIGTNINALRDSFGHLVGRFGYHLLVHVLSKYANIRITPKELLIPAAIDAFAEQLHQDSRLFDHYTAQFATVGWI